MNPIWIGFLCMLTSLGWLVGHFTNGGSTTGAVIGFFLASVIGFLKSAR